MTNPLTLVKQLDASTPRANRKQRQKSRRERRAAVKSAKNNAQK